MVKLDTSLQAWGTPGFKAILKSELESLPGGTLPLQRATNSGGIVDDTDISVSILAVQEYEDTLMIKSDVFFNEVVGGCSCGDEPFSQTACCKLEVRIDRKTAIVTFSILPD